MGLPPPFLLFLLCLSTALGRARQSGATFYNEHDPNAPPAENAPDQNGGNGGDPFDPTLSIPGSVALTTFDGSGSASGGSSALTTGFSGTASGSSVSESTARGRAGRTGNRSSRSARASRTTLSISSTGVADSTSLLEPSVSLSTAALTTTTATSLSTMSTMSTMATSGSAPTTSMSQTASSTSPTSSVLSTAGAQLASSNACVGDLDWQAWGTISSAVLGVVVGTAVWATWAALRTKVPSVYSPRASFLSEQPAFSVLNFLLPFLKLPPLDWSKPVSEGHVALHLMTGALKLCALLSLLALGAGLPIILAGSPCLSLTSPENSLGGHLGTLTDLSILRLLNALDPDPSSARGGLATRGLPLTVHSALGSARIRLIILLVIISVLGCGGGLFVIWRTHRTLVKGYKMFNKHRQKTDMAIVPVAAAPAWKGLSSESIQRWITERVGLQSKVCARGVFGIPHVGSLKSLLEERDKVLNLLEGAEARYISSFKVVHTSEGPRLRFGESGGGTSAPQDFVGPKDLYTLSPSLKPSKEPFDVTLPEFTEPAQPSKPHPDSRFREVNRDSVLYGGRFPLGQRVKVDEVGRWVKDPSSSSKESAPTAPEDPPQSLIEPAEPVETRSPLLPQNPCGRRSVIGQVYEDIRSHRAQLKEMNEEIENEQREARQHARNGDGVVGWVVVGPGMRYLKGAHAVEGLTREDIIWENVGKKSREGFFIVQAVLVGIVLAGLMVPFIGLSLASAPGFAHHLGFLRHLGRSDGLGSGIAQSVVPAIGLSLSALLAVVAVHYLSKHARSVSRMRQQILAFKTLFYLLLITTLFWPVSVAALEFAVAGFATDAQEARTVGDGAVFSTWLVFVVLLNVAIVVPGLVLLQPLRLWRCWRRSGSGQTPRQRYRERGTPPSFDLPMACAPFLVAVFYGLLLLFLFPLLAIPLTLLLYLLLVANRYMVQHVFIVKTGYGGGQLAMWAMRRLGWVLGAQPALFGLILLSRREWDIGGAGIGAGVTTIAFAELLTRRRYTDERDARRLLEDANSDLARTTDRAKGRVFAHPPSSESLLDRIGSMIPHERMDFDTVPYTTESLPDEVYAERASWTRGDLPPENPRQPRTYFYDPGESMRGLVYPPEILAPPPVVWLPWDKGGVSLEESNDLQRYHGLNATIDPPPNGEDGTVVGSWSTRPTTSSFSATM